MTTALLEEAEIQEADREAFRKYYQAYGKALVEAWGGPEAFRSFLLRDRPFIGSLQYAKVQR